MYSPGLSTYLDRQYGNDPRVCVDFDNRRKRHGFGTPDDAIGRFFVDSNGKTYGPSLTIDAPGEFSKILLKKNPDT